MKTISCGVPQGSVLGPLLFLLYVNDIHRSSTLLSFILFADDTNIFNSHSDINTLITATNEELKKVAEWLRANKLSLNIKKLNSLFSRQETKKQYTLVAAAFNSFVFSFACAFFPVIFTFFSYISLSRNQYSVRFFLHNVVLFSPFLHACNLAHFIISIATFQCSRSNLSSTSVSSFFLLPSHTTFVSIVYLRLVISVSSLYSLITCNLSYFILFCLSQPLTFALLQR